MGAECERVDDVAADAALVVTEGRYRHDPADQPTLWTPPNERDPIAELGKRKLERPSRRDAIAAVAEAGAAVFGNRGTLRLALLAPEERRGGRD